MKTFVRSITDLEREALNECHKEFGWAWDLSENEEVTVTNNICAVLIHHLGYNDLELIKLSYDEMEKLVNIPTVWQDKRGVFGFSYFFLSK